MIAFIQFALGVLAAVVLIVGIYAASNQGGKPLDRAMREEREKRKQRHASR